MIKKKIAYAMGGFGGVLALAGCSAISMNYVPVEEYNTHVIALAQEISEQMPQEIKDNYTYKFDTDLVRYGIDYENSKALLSFDDGVLISEAQDCKKVITCFEIDSMTAFYIDEDMARSRRTMLEGKMVYMGDLEFLQRTLQNDASCLHSVKDRNGNVLWNCSTTKAERQSLTKYSENVNLIK